MIGKLSRSFSKFPRRSKSTRVDYRDKDIAVVVKVSKVIFSFMLHVMIVSTCCGKRKFTNGIVVVF